MAKTFNNLPQKFLEILETLEISFKEDLIKDLTTSVLTMGTFLMMLVECSIQLLIQGNGILETWNMMFN